MYPLEVAPSRVECEACYADKGRVERKHQSQDMLAPREVVPCAGYHAPHIMRLTRSRNAPRASCPRRLLHAELAPSRGEIPCEPSPGAVLRMVIFPRSTTEVLTPGWVRLEDRTHPEGLQPVLKCKHIEKSWCIKGPKSLVRPLVAPGHAPSISCRQRSIPRIPLTCP